MLCDFFTRVVSEDFSATLSHSLKSRSILVKKWWNVTCFTGSRWKEMQHLAWWKMDDPMALHFLLHPSEGERLNMPVRRIAPRVVCPFIWPWVRRWTEGREICYEGQHVGRWIHTPNGNLKSADKVRKSRYRQLKKVLYEHKENM